MTHLYDPEIVRAQRVAAKRQRLVAYYYRDRTDQPIATRRELRAKIEAASDESILTDAPCVGKHSWLMGFDDRETCPYCGWQLTRRPT